MSARRYPLLLALAVSLAACREQRVESYRIPKETDPSMPMPGADMSGQGPSADSGSSTNAGGSAMAGAAVDVAQGPGLSWSAPASWVLRPPAPMRKATYGIPGPGGSSAELSITAFPGDVGGELANLNRWRGQVQLPPVGSADALGEALVRFDSAGLSFAVVDFAGPAQRMLGGIAAYGGSTWFFKVTGSAPAIEAAKPAFLEFLHTVKPAQP